jgi:hypothetical protein
MYRHIRRVGLSVATVACLTLLFSLAAHAQGGVPLVTVATDQSNLGLSNQFGVPAGAAINQAGDFAFIGQENSALFFRAASASSASIVLQAGDPVPGFPGSVVQSFSSTIDINSTKVLLICGEFQLARWTPTRGTADVRRDEFSHPRFFRRRRAWFRRRDLWDQHYAGQH